MSASPVLIVGAGPAGMTAALDLAHYGIGCTLFDEDHVLSEGSRAIAFSAETLATWERLGAVEPMLAKGVAWSVRHTYFRDHELFTQNFPQQGAGFLPRFFNLQQFYVERYLLDCVEASPLINLRWDHKVKGCSEDGEMVTLQVTTPAGDEEFSGKYVLACDGARSSLRKLLNLPFPGVTHSDHFLIADIRADLPWLPEPRFFFDPPTNPGQTILIHPQPDGIWRIDWQVGPEVDMQVERDPVRMDRRIRALIGDAPYEVVWLSDYRFHQRLLDQFRHGKIFFLGDAAHLVSPFGARGLNSAVGDVENLVWKLAFVMKYGAAASLLDSYQDERWPAQQHNQMVTNATMQFMSPPDRWQKMKRNLILRLSAFYRPARRWVDSGKMVDTFTYTGSPLITADNIPVKDWRDSLSPGSKVPDVACICYTGDEYKPVFLRSLLGSGFVVLRFGVIKDETKYSTASDWPCLQGIPIRFYTILKQKPERPTQEPVLIDVDGRLYKTFAAQPGTIFLIRPDGHVSARRRSSENFDLAGMLCRACGMG